MKTIVAGSRKIKSYSVVAEAIEASGFDVTEVVSGTANGVDTLGENWAEQNDRQIKRFPADWKNIRVKGAIIRQNQYGKYNAAAGGIRNKKMAEYADALISVWDGKSKGTADMILQAHRLGLRVFVFIVGEQQ